MDTGGGRDTATLVVGLDIGTTFSGLNFQLQKGGQALDIIREVRAWPTLPGHARETDQVKVPTKVDYGQRWPLRNDDDHDDEDDCDDRGPIWGYLVANDTETSIEWPKLLLLKKDDLPPHLRESTSLNKARSRLQALRPRKTAVDVVADYVKQLWMHAFGDDDHRGYIDRHLRLHLHLLPLLKASEIRTHVIVTIPAIWKNDAVHAMENALAASILGQPHISYEFMSEPEAGMMALTGQIQGQMQVNDVAVCLDLGGGTADCISYKLTSTDPLMWEEVVTGDGDLCGAMFLDEAFHKLLREVLHHSGQTLTRKGWKSILQNNWEHSIKRDFDFVIDEVDRFRQIELSSVTNEYINLHDNQLRDIFGSVTNRILDLVQRQVDAVKEAQGGRPPKAIALVGGFGRCPFVRGALIHRFGGDGGGVVGGLMPRTKKAMTARAKKDPIFILSDAGDLPWTAICRGAVLSKLAENAHIQSRKARYSFGFIQNGLDQEGGIWDPLLGCHVIPDMMTWILKRGDSISASDKILQQSLVFNMDVNETEELAYRAKFYAHPSEEPPSRFGHNPGAFRSWGTINIKVPVTGNQLPIREDNTGGESRIFDYDLHINCKGEGIHVAAFSVDTEERLKVGELALENIV